MSRHSKKYLCALGFALGISTWIAAGRQNDALEGSGNADARQQKVLKIAAEVHKRILRLPQYGVFDSLHFAIKGDNTVILRGMASRPSLKSGAENVAKKIEGVTKVENEIEVLPLSPNDDRIRAAVYASIYTYGPLQRYTANRGGGRLDNSITRRAGGITQDPPIGWHAISIVVKNGNVMLVGVVDNTGDLAIAEMRANQVPGVFSVENKIQVATQESK